MYYKGHNIKSCIQKYEDSGFAKVLLVNQDGTIMEEMTENPIEVVVDTQSALIGVAGPKKDIKPKYAIFKQEFNHLVPNDFVREYSFTIQNQENNLYRWRT